MQRNARWLLVVASLLSSFASACVRALDDPNNSAPIAVAGDDVDGSVGETVTLNGSASLDDDGDIASFAWSFGDGEEADGAVTSHAWSSVGGFITTLTVTDDDDAISTDTVVVRITEPAPTAVFTSAASGVVGGAILFDASSSHGPSPVVGYAWDFGDGETATGPTVAHAFARTGTFRVELIVTDDQDRTGSSSTNVTIAPPNIAGTWDLTAPSFSCASYDIAFPDQTLVVTQDGTDLSALGANNRVYDGALDDGEIVLSTTANLPTGGGCGTASVNIVLRGDMSGAASFSGRATGFFDLGIGCQCSAAWDVQGERR